MTFKVIRGQGQGQEMTSVPYRDYFIPDNPGEPVLEEAFTKRAIVVVNLFFSYPQMRRTQLLASQDI